MFKYEVIIRTRPLNGHQLGQIVDWLEAAVGPADIAWQDYWVPYDPNRLDTAIAFVEERHRRMFMNYCFFTGIDAREEDKTW